MERLEARRFNKPILHDPLIIPRVKQYLEENVHQTYVDVDVMARHLQEKYRDYGRRKIQVFRSLVDQAYKTVLHTYGLDSNPSTDDDENSDLELMDETSIGHSNHMNDMLTNMYTAGNRNKSSAVQNAGESICLSSDESGGESSENKTAANNGRVPKALINYAKELTITKNALPSISSVLVSTETTHKTPKSELVGSATILPTANKKRKIDSRRVSTNDGAIAKINKDLNLSIAGRSAKKVKKEFSVGASPVSFKNIGGIDKILKELCELLLHIKHPNVYKHIGLPPPRGFLLHGPPGSGKTLLAQAIAGQLQIGLIQVAATELIAGVSGESEERIRELFERAAAAAPCVLFIDEIDAISSNRLNAQKDMERRIVAQLLISLDGLSKFDNGTQVLVIGATNRADALDPALRRVGRFDQEISLGIPDREARSQILRVICNDLRLEKLFDFEKIAALTPGYVGADLLALATRAASLAVKRIFHEKEEHTLKANVSKMTGKHTIALENMPKEIFMQIDDFIEKVLEDEKEDAKSLELVKKKTDEEVEKEKVDKSTDDTNENVVMVDSSIETPNDSVTELKENDTKEVNENAPKIVEDGLEAATNQEENSDQDTKMEVTENAIESTSNAIEIVESDGNETLGEALLKNSAIKEQMGLDVMFKWLSNAEPLVTENELKELFITMSDFIDATKIVQPSAKREGFITVPDVTWNDIGSLRDIRQELNLAILAPVKYPNRLKTLGLHAPSGVLLCGPPGCGKTLLAKAVANEAGINFISVKGPELLNMYVGESERAVRQCFQRARNSAPCVIFFDEFDALCPKRSGSTEGSASSRVVNQLLTEMDGVEERKNVFLMAATNRPDMVDPAVLRPGRLDKILYVGLPEEQDRLEILQALTKKGTEPTLADDVCLNELAKLTESFTGADLAGLVRQASLQALKESISTEINVTDSDSDLKVNNKHFALALQHLRPSVTAEDKLRYEKLRIKYAAVPEQ